MSPDMFRTIATNQRRRLVSDIVIGVALALGLTISVAAVDTGSPGSRDAVSAPSDCDLPYADQVALQAAGELSEDLDCS